MVGKRVARSLLAALAAVMLACEANQDSELGSVPPEWRDRRLTVDVNNVFDRLVLEEDTDGDRKITVADGPLDEAGHGDQRFWLPLATGDSLLVRGTYNLANLLQELRLSQLQGLDTAELDPEKLFEPPVDRISRLIRERYWDGLTRRIDGAGLESLLRDEKADPPGSLALYVPFTDSAAVQYYRVLATRMPELHVVQLPARVTPEYVESLRDRQGLLTLALRRDAANGNLSGVPFVVPGGRFNEMYGWDSFFIALGLLVDGRVELARAMVDNFVYQIEYYGKILNANRSYYLTRSQPPFLTSMALAIYEHIRDDPGSRNWLADVLEAAIREYATVWMAPERLDERTGLSHYFGAGLGQPPEAEPGHFDHVYRRFARTFAVDPHDLQAGYLSGTLPDSIRRALDDFFRHDRCMRESGHDTTYRWQRDGDRCTDFVTVDLNSLLYKIELDVARTVEREFGGELVMENGQTITSQDWYDRATRRKDAIRRYLWDPQRSLFFDYDLRVQSRHDFVAATALYPLWASYPDDPRSRILTQDEADRLVGETLSLLEEDGGIVGSTDASRGDINASEVSTRPPTQWDYPHGWAPHQMLAWQGLINYGHEREVQRIVYRWLYMITRNAVEFNGTIPEKYDVVKRSHDVFAEYGNVGTNFDYITDEGFGWMNASYQVGLGLLRPDLRERLNRLVAPKDVAF
jgi:alpha,alpha-trehalase